MKQFKKLKFLLLILWKKVISKFPKKKYKVGDIVTYKLSPYGPIHTGVIVGNPLYSFSIEDNSQYEFLIHNIDFINLENYIDIPKKAIKITREDIIKRLKK